MVGQGQNQAGAGGNAYDARGTLAHGKPDCGCRQDEEENCGGQQGKGDGKREECRAARYQDQKVEREGSVGDAKPGQKGGQGDGDSSHDDSGRRVRHRRYATIAGKYCHFAPYREPQSVALCPKSYQRPAGRVQIGGG